MDPNRASETALDTALVRALDNELLRPPVLADPLSAVLLSPAERDLRESQVIGEVLQQSPELKALTRDELLRIALQRNANSVSLILSRARYAEATLSDAMTRGVRQYVLVGAGLDTFAFRHPEYHDRLTIFEIDHPLSQADKRERLRRMALEMPANLHLGACDFEIEGVEAALTCLPYDPGAPAFFACLGVTMYLTPAALEATLRSLREVSLAGSELVFDYLEAHAMETYAARENLRSNIERVRNLGEPVLGPLSSGTLPAELRSLGFELIDDLGPETLQTSYFQHREDHLLASEVGHVAHCKSSNRGWTDAFE
jgi:methyltransferase (TIGR00027 family)